MNKLAFSRAHYHAVKLRIGEDHPDLDEETLADTVEGLTDLHDIVAAILRSAVTDEALGKGLRVPNLGHAGKAITAGGPRFQAPPDRA